MARAVGMIDYMYKGVHLRLWLIITYTLPKPRKPINTQKTHSVIQYAAT
ncbi:hypothetical protein FOQG_02603 [Fusarium oxysporum f. sp. raphani 54005]|jgi:hypothetical protein|uniref:Uncharacterized protein n=4 Tax=Fusarium oxysporum TaxID=5507 RepID=X0DT01_FUSOX|nr:hypothetical protein FOMG_03816 [Fusarium oxysporum f. sp. melonis 26406]EXK97387.1 hypothetical protein FOQG_02603 [Fusarium oxysporum f. sp. raphani 54005]EXL78556.1 hypothetical protein FOPG_07253 [Fusarium oxysporum f. sp. conglutinans race 2 54008]EXM25970.1 hypothetical protein FOTG_07656 [Fusarium oxysporum f. sp. vasinfectum 25433]